MNIRCAQVSELWGGQAKKKNAEQQEDVGDKILDVLAGGKGKKQKEKEAQKNWFASKVGRGNTSSHPIAALIVFRRSTRWPAEAKLESSTRINWTRVRGRPTMERSALLTDSAAVDLFQQHILKQGDQVRAGGLL